MAAPPSARRRRTRSGWGALRMRHQDVVRTLRQRHSLRLHGVLIGSFTLLLTWAASHLQMRLGVDSLALRYLVSLGVGYVAYLCVLRWWAARLVQPREDEQAEALDVADALLPDPPWPSGGGGMPLPRAGGGDFAGAGAHGDWANVAGDFAGQGLGELAGGALEVAGSADEGAIVVVPVVAIFLIGAALLFGVGALAWLYFGWEVLLAVAVELAFSLTAARAAVGVEREGWLSAAVRLTWKPLAGAIVCAVALGATLDHFTPQAQSLPEALRLITHR